MRSKMKAQGFSLSLLLFVASANGRTLNPNGGQPYTETWSHRTLGMRNVGPATPLAPVDHFQIMNNSIAVRDTVVPSPAEARNSDDLHHCNQSGVFPTPGSCRDFYQCEQLPKPHGLFSVQLFSCPLGTVFAVSTHSCVLTSAVTHLPECTNEESSASINMNRSNSGKNANSLIEHPVDDLHPLSRSKRFAAVTLFAGLSAVATLAIAANGIFNTGSKLSRSGGGIGDLRVLENKLLGMEGKIKDVGLSVLESRIKAKINSAFTQSLINKDITNNQINFESTQLLINRGFLENRINAAAIQGLIVQGNIDNELNFARVQVSISELKQFINEEVSKAKAVLQRGFESISTSINLSKIEPVVSRLLTLIKGFHEKLSHLQSLPNKNRKDEIERNGGYLEYLESSTLQEMLYGIIQQNMAKPSTASDLTAVFILDLLVHGLQVHTSMLSSVVSSNVYLATESLKQRDLEEFNTYMSRVHSAVTKVKIVLGYGDRQGLISEVSQVLRRVQQLPYAGNILGLSELLRQKMADIGQLESYVEDLVIDNTELSVPGTIIRKPDFTSSLISVPMGSWEVGKRVSYAVQFVSERGLSQVGVWSAPYTIQDKANPTIQLARIENGTFRLLYRRFNQEKPELVAAIRDNEQTILRDIDRDLLNAAARPNEDLAVKQIKSLLGDGANIGISLEDKMTPLHYAAKHGNVQVMDILINSTADIRADASDNQEPLHFAALFGAKEGIEYLISKGADINAQTRLLGLSPLHIAVANSHLDATRALIDSGAFVNIKDNGGLTPLHISVAGNGDTIDVLLENVQLDVNAVTNDGLTPLHYAADSSSNVFIQKLLQDINIDVNAVSDSLLTPLHLAAIGGNADIIAELVQHGARISSVDRYGSTPLHYAAFYGNKRASLVLMNLDPSLEDVKNIADKTALDLAVENGREEVINVLGSDQEKLVKIVKQEFIETFTVLESAPDTEGNLEQSITSNCSSEVVNQMAKGSEETCTHIGYVESYVNLVMGMVPLKVYYIKQMEFSQVFHDYDNDLVAAQGHAKIWRNGDSIINGIRLTFELARMFEPEFSRKYKINKQRIERIKADTDQVQQINQINYEIQILEDQLLSTTEAMKKVDDEDVSIFFRNLVSSYERQIQEKEQTLKSDFKLIFELEELVDFLEFVRSDSSKIQKVALTTRGKIETFMADFEQDRDVFKRHGTAASAGLQRLVDESVNRDKALGDHRREMDELEVEIQKQQLEVKNRFERISKSHKELLDMRRRLLDEIQSSRTWKLVGAILSPEIVGTPILAIASDADKKLISLLQLSIRVNKEEVDKLTQEIESKSAEIYRFRQSMANSPSNSEIFQNEMLNFISLDRDLNTLSTEVDTLLQNLGKAVVGLEVIKGVFADVTNKLGIMIDKATTAKTDAGRMNAKYFIHNELLLLECDWRDVYIKVMNLEECRRNFEVLYGGTKGN